MQSLFGEVDFDHLLVCGQVIKFDNSTAWLHDLLVKVRECESKSGNIAM